jgi:hypothetical protein
MSVAAFAAVVFEVAAEAGDEVSATRCAASGGRVVRCRTGA